MKKEPTMKQKLEAVEAFNFLFSIGDPVTVSYNDKLVETVTVTKAGMLNGHTPVVWVYDIKGCIALSHVVIKMKRKTSDLLGITYFVPDCKNKLKEEQS